MATAGSATTLTDNTDVQITYNTEVYDYNNNFASSTYTAPVAGVYHFNAVAGIAGAITGPIQAYISLRKNDSTILYGTQDAIGGGNNSHYIISCDLLLAANDTIKVYFFQNSDSNEATDGNNIEEYFSGHLVHQVI